MTFFLAILFTGWTLSLWIVISRVLIPYIAQRIDERRWQKMHPGMPSWRRVRT
jgi:hypothetical protein